jgi:hypothetical protein
MEDLVTRAKQNEVTAIAAPGGADLARAFELIAALRADVDALKGTAPAAPAAPAATPATPAP